MIVTSEFLAAKRHKELRAFLVIQRPNEGTNMRLCFDTKNKITGKRDMVHIECQTEIKIDDFGAKPLIESICFHESVWYRYQNHVNSFLQAIGKNSEVSFLVLVNNNNDNYKNVGFVCHQLTGIIDNKSYLLSKYVGPNNSASPIQF